MEKKTEEAVREAICEIDRLTKQRIREALEVFYTQPGEQTLYGVFDEILNGYMFNTVCYVPATLAPDRNGILIKTMYEPERAGNAYILFTGMKEAESPAEIYVGVSYRTVIRQAACDESIIGIRVNPSDSHPNMLMSRQNIRAIMQTGEERISGFMPDFREALEKYQVKEPECGPGGRSLSSEKNSDRINN